jgi:hypothetical protein
MLREEKKMKRRMLIPLLLLLAVFVLSWGIDQGWAQPPATNKEMKYRGGKVTTAEKKAAAKRAKALGLKPGVAGLDAAEPAGLQPEVPRKVLKKR